MTMQPREEMEIIVRFIAGFVIRLPLLLVSAFQAAVFVISALSWIFDERQFWSVGAVVFFSAAAVAAAAPGLCLFLLYDWCASRGKRQPDNKVHIMAGILLAALNGLAFVVLLERGFDHILKEGRFIVPIFAVTGGLTAVIHWKITRFAKAFAVTCRSESARYVDI